MALLSSHRFFLLELFPEVSRTTDVVRGLTCGLVCPPKVLHWPSVFHIFGSLGVVWWALWEWRAASSPDTDPLCSESERALLASTTVKRVRIYWPCCPDSVGCRVTCSWLDGCMAAGLCYHDLAFILGDTFALPGRAWRVCAIRAGCSCLLLSAVMPRDLAWAGHGFICSILASALQSTSQPHMVHWVQLPTDTIPWRLLLSKAPVWALIVCHFCHNWGTFILLTWMPTYYNQARLLPPPLCLPSHNS